MRTIVVFSGGLDSTVILAGCVADGDEVLALSFDYGQKHWIELERAAEIAIHYGVPFEKIKIPPMPLVSDVVFAGRNFVFASLAVAIAQARKFNRVAFGCNRSDWKDFPDCRPSFWYAIEDCARVYNVNVLTPLLHLTKRDIVDGARKLSVPIEFTWSCYSPIDDKPCGKCLACKTREEAMK